MELAPLAEDIRSLSLEQVIKYWDALEKAHGIKAVRELCLVDRYYLLVRACGQHHALHPWLYERCREVEANTDGYLDLWAREHYKSTIITFAGCVQEILKDPNVTIGIFSHTKGIARAFLNQIKRELESNEVLKKAFPEILWERPSRDAPSWSLDGGIVVNRTENPKEATVEAWGLVDGQPTSKHYKLMVYDDVVTRESVNTPDQIAKTTDGWELSRNLASKTERGYRTWMIGTRYNYADTYKTIMDREAVIPRIYPATKDGTFDGETVFLDQKDWESKKKESSDYTIACQMLQNPSAGGEQEFKPEWLRYYELRPKTLNVYILCDYAGSRASTGSSNTAYAAIGVDANMNKYLLDGVCHKLTLEDRWRYLRDMRRKWLRQEGVQYVSVGYERFSTQSDIEHFEAMMKIEGDYFSIEELNWPRDGDVAKDNRIRRLQPDFKNWRFFLPYSGEVTRSQRDARVAGNGYLISRPIKQKDQDGKIYDVVERFIKNEYLFFPNTTIKDFLDAMSRIYDIDIAPPQIIDDEMLEPEVYPDS